jgi:acetyl-CoA carboxylase biotin carboxylase subunit
VDDGFEEGMDIPIYYDPMLAKLIAYGAYREEAIQRLLRAIDDYKIVGVKTTLAFGKFVLQHPDFVSGKFDTHFVAKNFTPDLLKTENAEELEIAALFAAHWVERKATNAVVNNHNSSVAATSNWRKNRLGMRG